ARGLQRGSGFLHPQMETGPFPNLFLVEPPISAQLAAWISIWSGMPLDESGRLLSAAGITLGAWGLYGLMRRRRGSLAAVGAVIAFASFPVTIRYGRAFQPDAMALGLLVAALNCWDVPGACRTAAGAFLMAAALAQRVTWSLSVFPALFVVWNGRRRSLWLLASGCLLPALAWYFRAALILSVAESGSTASLDNAANWCARLLSPAFSDGGRLVQILRDLVVRSFTPLGFCLALGSLFLGKGMDRLWKMWALGGGVTLLVLYGKLHHDYYWLVLAPSAAGGVGIALTELAARSRRAAAIAVTALLLLGLVQSRSTWVTPAEWRDAPELGALVSRHVPPDRVVIAPEAVIYLGDRRGCRLEWNAVSVRRAANEWRPLPAFTGDSPSDLVAFYRRHAGARFFADLDNVPSDSPRGRLHQALRRDAEVRIIEDHPGRFLLVEFVDPE
ncbi:MAG TPA: hypothetical protein VGH33_27770, partial [Isosphaeraceae bacterium]